MWIIKHIYKKPFPQYQKATPSPPVESLPENNNCTLSQYFHCVCFFCFVFVCFLVRVTRSPKDSDIFYSGKF